MGVSLGSPVEEGTHYTEQVVLGFTETLRPVLSLPTPTLLIAVSLFASPSAPAGLCLFSWWNTPYPFVDCAQVSLQHLRLWTLNQDVFLVCSVFEFPQHGSLSDWCLVDVC